MKNEDANPLNVNSIMKQFLSTKSKQQQTIYPLKSSTNTFYSALNKKKSSVFSESVCCSSTSSNSRNNSFKTGNYLINNLKKSAITQLKKKVFI